MKKFLAPFLLATVSAALALVFANCGGGGGGGGGADGAGFTITGDVYTTKREIAFRSGGEAAGVPPITAYTQIRLVGANVTLCKPTPSGIALISGAPATRTTSSRGYTLITKMQVAAVESNQPLFVCASNPDGRYTLLSAIPADLVAEGKIVSLNVSPESTIIGWMICPGGKFPPERGPCFTVNQTALDNLNSVFSTYCPALSENERLDHLNFTAYLWYFVYCPEIADAIGRAAANSGAAPPQQGDFNTASDNLPIVSTPADGGDEPEPDGKPETSPFQGSVSGSWRGSCPGFGGVSGGFSISIDANGKVIGVYSGDESGSITGDVDTSGNFYAAGTAGGDITWRGTISKSGGKLSGSGTWSEPVLGCSGSWSGSGTYTGS